MHLRCQCFLFFLQTLTLMLLFIETLLHPDVALSLRHMAGGAQLRAQGEEMRTYAGMVRDLVQAIQISGLKISLPAPHLVLPLTSEPPRSADTQ
ncbi:unnamed protein product [Malus baccata var. baccata]